MARRVTATFGVAALLAVALSCDDERDREFQTGVHPVGWPSPESSSFHGSDMAANGYPFDECRMCHGDNLGGGPIEVPCSNGDCHPSGVDACGTCHGDLADDPLPESGAHATHEAFCELCHPVPTQFERSPHLDGVVDLAFAGLATSGGSEAAFEPEARTCSDAYCHFSTTTPAWEDTTPLGCESCHPTAPKHQRFGRVVSDETCSDCHPGAGDIGHIDGDLLILVNGCVACHGHSGDGAPPPALDGATSPTAPGVGAHRRHLDPFAPGRMSVTAPCSACHRVPSSLFAAGHLDDAAPADVDVVIGEYDPAARTCEAWCHVDGRPEWTDDSGAARACDACHGFPPLKTRSGFAHVNGPAELDFCRGCHPFSANIHVNGVVNL